MEDEGGADEFGDYVEEVVGVPDDAEEWREVEGVVFFWGDDEFYGPDVAEGMDYVIQHGDGEGVYCQADDGGGVGEEGAGVEAFDHAGEVKKDVGDDEYGGIGFTVFYGAHVF